MGGYVDPAETFKTSMSGAAELLELVLQRIALIERQVERLLGQRQEDDNMGAASNGANAAPTASPAQERSAEPSSPTSGQTASATATASSGATTNDGTKRRSPQTPKKKGKALQAHLEAKTTSPHKLTDDVLINCPKAAAQKELIKDYVRLKILEDILTRFLNMPGQEDFKEAWEAFFGDADEPAAPQ